MPSPYMVHNRLVSQLKEVTDHRRRESLEQPLSPSSSFCWKMRKESNGVWSDWPRHSRSDIGRLKRIFDPQYSLSFSTYMIASINGRNSDHLHILSRRVSEFGQIVSTFDSPSRLAYEILLGDNEFLTYASSKTPKPSSEKQP